MAATGNIGLDPLARPGLVHEMRARPDVEPHRILRPQSPHLGNGERLTAPCLPPDWYRFLASALRTPRRGGGRGDRRLLGSVKRSVPFLV